MGIFDAYMSAVQFRFFFWRPASLLAVWSCLLLTCPQIQAAEATAVTQLKLRVVGGLAGLHQYTRHEEPFWSQELTRLSQGKYSADIVPFDSAGVPGGDMLRLLELGVVPFGTMLMSSLHSAHPLYAGLDLAGLSPEFTSLKKAMAASRGFLESHLRTHHNVQILALYTYPAQVLFCKQAFVSLTDLQGRRVRVSSLSQSDFFQALGAKPVTTAFRQITAHFLSGDIDCAVTGTMSGYTLGLQKITTHIHTLPITWGLAIFAANKTAWDSLPPDLRALLSRELPRVEAAVWQESEQETAEGLACHTGAKPCTAGPPGRLSIVPHSPADELLRQSILKQTVLPRWLARCGPDCAAVWQQTLGPALKIELTP